MTFSTHPDPIKSKSKCIYMCGSTRNISYPAPLKLYGTDLPWVLTATHLGHELHQMCSMEHDIKTKKAMFINNSTDIRDTFRFAKPDQILKATSLYCCHLYGAMLWDISSDMCGQFCRSWNTAVKLAWQVPWSTHTYLVNNVLGVNHPSIEEQLIVRYVNFFKKLRTSKSDKIQLLANIVARDIRSTTGKNLNTIEARTGLDPWSNSANLVKESLVRQPVPDEDLWRVPLLVQYLEERTMLEVNMEQTDLITDLIDSLCSS